MNLLSMPFYLLRVLFLTGLVALGLSACGSGGSNGGGGSSTGTLQSIEISPLGATAPAGTTQQYTAMAIYSNNTKLDVTGSTAWSSSDSSIATINSNGLATAVKVGTATLSGSYQGKSATTTLTVSAAIVRSIAVTPANAMLSKGSRGRGTATATFSDGSTANVTSLATWASSSTAVATVSNVDGSRGEVTALTEGNSSISATYQNVQGATALTVTAAKLTSIQVTPAGSSIAKGTTQQFTATGIYSDNSKQNLTTTVTWASSNTAIATISNTAGSNGLATGAGVGTATISATSGTISGSTGLTVTNATLTAIQVTPATASRPKGATQQFTATGTFTDQSTQDVTASVVWSSSTTSVATISNASGSSGLATAVAQGSSTITAASGSLSSTATLTVTAAAFSRIDVTPASPSIPVGATQQFTASAVYTDNTTQDVTSSATWSSSDTSILEISNSSGQKGFAVANKQGSSTVSAVSMGMTGSTVATVSSASLTAIQVTPSNKNLAKGFSLQYTATGTYSDNSTRDVTTQVSWSVSNSAAASISNADGSHGLLTAASTPGSTNVTAALGSISGSTSLTVTNATLSSIAVTPSTSSVAKGGTVQLAATGTFSDSSTQNLTEQASWSSADTTKVTVSSSAGTKGLVTAVAVSDSTVITASVSNATTTAAVKNTATVKVTGATLSSIEVSPASVSLAKGNKQVYKATGTYSDNSTADITSTVTWSSSDTNVATIVNGTGTDKGTATAFGVGSATITAALGSVSGTASITVTSAVLTSIAVTPDKPSIAAGRSQQFTATGTYSDTTTQNLTTSVTWSSDTPSVATISNASGSAGLASSSKAGSTLIKAVSGSISSADDTLTVTNAVPTSIAVTPANQTVGLSSSLQYTATETFSDGTTSDQTATLTWLSSNTAVADVSNAAGSKGLATTKTQGTVDISATDSSAGITAKTSLTVGPATLQTITIAAKDAAPAGYKVQYTAVGGYSDGSSQDVTNIVTWSSLNTAIATVSNASGSQGLVTNVAAGTTSLVATKGNISDSQSITVSTATLKSIDVTPKTPTIVGSATLQFKAIATFTDDKTLDVTTQVTWASSSTQTISIGSATGLATGGTLPGNATITATKGSIAGQTTATHNLR